jgi:hypothetical protein
VEINNTTTRGGRFVHSSRCFPSRPSRAENIGPAFPALADSRTRARHIRATTCTNRVRPSLHDWSCLGYVKAARPTAALRGTLREPSPASRRRHSHNRRSIRTIRIDDRSRADSGFGHAPARTRLDDRCRSFQSSGRTMANSLQWYPRHPVSLEVSYSRRYTNVRPMSCIVIRSPFTVAV